MTTIWEAMETRLESNRSTAKYLRPLSHREPCPRVHPSVLGLRPRLLRVLQYVFVVPPLHDAGQFRPF